MISNITYAKTNVKRFNEIIGVLAKYGLAEWFSDGTPGFIRRRFLTPDGERVKELPFNVRVRMALTELGTTFIKLGQMMSTRSDMVGPELAEELASLQADTPADPPDLVRATVERELGQPIEELFAEFDFNSLASASVGQVHLARLKDGSPVVVKVQHAGIERKVRGDLNLLTTLAQLAEQNSKEIAYYRPTATVAEFQRSLLRELDFTTELANLQRFARNFADSPYVAFPTAFPTFSSRRVLTMARLDGYSIADTARLAADGVDTKALARRFVDVMLEMIFRDGFYHADPHPGNIFALPGGRVGLLDCGKIGRVDEQTQDDFINIVQAFLAGDAEVLTDELIRLCDTPSDLNRTAYQTDVAEFVMEFGDSEQGVKLGPSFESMFAIIRRHHLIVPARVNMLLLVIVQLEGAARGLDPDFNIVESLQRHGAGLVRRRLSPARLQRYLMRSYRDWNRLIKTLPREMAELLEQTRRGELQIHVHQHGLETPINRLAIGIMIAALFLGSALLWAFGAPPVLFGISIFGALGVAFSLFLGFMLLFQIWRSGNRL